MIDHTKAAVALIHVDEPEPAVLLIRRSMRDDDPWSGHWALPGGRREGGESPLDCARRETREEVGLDLPTHCDERLTDTTAGSAVGRPVEVAVFRWRLPLRPTDLRLDRIEVAGVHWLPCALLADVACHERRPMAARLPERLFACLPFAEPPLWGFTYRVLCRWWNGSVAGE